MAKPPSDIDNYRHADAKRRMIPTAEQQGYVEEEEARPKSFTYARNRDLDPQFVWRGKEEEDAADLTVAAPPVYIQEKVHPRQIIERLKRDSAARRRAAEPMPDLFGDFNGLPKELGARTEFYAHDQNWQNRMILGDSLMVMASLAEREGLRGKVQCIYMDPPYGIKFNSNWQASTGSRDVKDGSAAHISREPEVIRAFRDTWRDGIHSYLSYLRDRLILARELLTDSGSIFVQIGDENVHRVRAVMDEVFGEGNFVSEISVKKTSSATAELLPGVQDYILWFAKNRETIKYRQPFIEKRGADAGLSGYTRVILENGARLPLAAALHFRGGNLLLGDKSYAQSDLTSQRPPGDFPVEVNGITYRPRSGYWKTGLEGFPRLIRSERIEVQGRTLRYIRFYEDFGVFPVTNFWDDISGAVQSRTDPKIYVVQSSSAIAQRCLLMTTDPGDLVLDPTCGSGTTAHVAEQWGRRWITIDTSRVALALARARIMGARYPWHLLADSAAGRRKEAEITGVPPIDAPTGERIERGFVYRRVPHITLKSIANNAEIDILWDQLNPAVETALAALNASLKGQPEPFPVTTGGRAGAVIDFTAKGEVKMPSGETAPANGFMEWEVPREPGAPWPKDQAKLHALASAEATTPARQRKAETALADLNAARGADWTFQTLPDAPLTPWPVQACEALAAFWEARIARQKAIDKSIEREGARNAEFLFDKPYEDPKITRVAGPFTVESLSPYRVIPSADDPALLAALEDDKGGLPRRTVSVEQTDFAEVVIENLRAAGVQNTKKKERLEFESIRPWPGDGFVAFEGRYEENGASKRAAIAIGPEYGAVDYQFVREAARGARDAFDILIVCGFQFTPEVDDSRLNFGRLRVLKARMNQDIRMDDKLKKTGAGNLFVVFGEPDVRIHELKDGMIRVEIMGVDIFDPTTGEVKSSDDPAEDIACWFIDDDYDEESFFVRQAYFLGGAGGNDPYKALKRSLKAEIDETAWASLQSAKSIAFSKPKSGRIGVKVINHFGDEVQKVYKV